MEPVNIQCVIDTDAIPSVDRGGGLSGVGTGGGKTELDTTHFLKDNEIGGALPDTQEGIDAAVQAIQIAIHNIGQQVLRWEKRVDLRKVEITRIEDLEAEVNTDIRIKVTRQTEEITIPVRKGQ